MASVYRCHEPSLDRQVALKVLPREFLHEDTFAERFRREAKVIARLEHPNIVPIHSYGIEDGIPWMAMRLVSGGSLSGVLKAKRLDMRQIVSVLRGVADALDYAHSQGIVHRDVKPQNILLDDAARVYLADFGIAKIVESSGGLTATGMITGTPQYMAPEQAKGQGIDHRADIYALGIVAYELLTGQTPFSADTPVGVLMKHLSEPVPRPSAIDVPPGASEALLKCLAKDPDERWPTALAFVEALELGLLPTAPTVPQAAVAGPTVTGRATEPSTRQNPRAVPDAKAARQSSVGLFLLLGAMGLVLIGALGLGVYYVMRPTPPPAMATTSQADAVPAPVVTVPEGSSSSDVAPPPLSPTATPQSATAPPAIAPGTVAPEPTRHRPGSTTTGSPAVVATTDTTLPPPSTSSSLTTSPTVPAPSLPAVASLTGTIDFATGVVPLDVQSGALSAASVRFQTRDGRSGRFKRMITKGEDVVTLTASFEVLRKRKSGDWKLALTVELLDEAGKSVGSFTDRADIEDDKTTVNLVHEMPKKELALVKHARIGFVAAQ